METHRIKSSSYLLQEASEVRGAVKLLRKFLTSK